MTGEPTHTGSKEKNGATRPTINYHLKSEVSIMLCYHQLCSTRYTALRIKNRSKSTTAIKVATMKNTDDFHYEEKRSHDTRQIDTFHCQQR